MYVIEYRATAANAPLLFWEVTPSTPHDPDGKPVQMGPLGRMNGYERRVIGRVQTLDAFVGLLANQDVGEIRVSEAEAAWKAAEGRRPATERRVRPRGTSASDPIVVAGTPAYGATSSTLASAADSTTLSLTLLFIAVLAFVILWIALL